MKTILVAVLLCSCGGNPSHVGTWRHAATVCNGADLLIPGYTATYEIGERTASVVEAISGCAATLTDVPVTTVGGKVELMEGAAGGVACTPNPCVMDFGAGKLSCPSQFPISGAVLRVESVTAETMTATAAGCTMTLVRQ